MKHLMLIVFAVALAACQTTGPRPDGSTGMTEREQIALGCQGAQLTVVVLDGLNAELARELTEAQLRAVNAAKTSVLAICANPPQTLVELKARGFAEAASMLSRELAAYLESRSEQPKKPPQ